MAQRMGEGEGEEEGEEEGKEVMVSCSLSLPIHSLFSLSLSLRLTRSPCIDSERYVEANSATHSKADSDVWAGLQHTVALFLLEYHTHSFHHGWRGRGRGRRRGGGGGGGEGGERGNSELGFI